MLKIAREPLLHFVVAGAALFAIYAALNSSADKTPSPTIRISAQDVQWLAESWARQQQRAPTPDELRWLVVDYLNEQLLAREARALGLDDNDTVVRRRLAQKLTFILDDTLRRAEPTEAELQQFYERHAERFRSEARLSFVQIYFDPARRVDAAADAQAALKTLQERGASAGGLGDRTLIEAEFQDESDKTVTSLFGPDFARALALLPPGEWSGPVQSAYGLHLVRVSDMRAARLPALPDIRTQVMEEWRREQEALAKEKYLATLRKKYDVIVDDNVTSLLATTLAAKVAP